MLLPFSFGGIRGQLSRLSPIRSLPLLLTALAMLLTSCSTMATAVRGNPAPTLLPTPLPSRSAVEILAHHDLPKDDERSAELSGITWDGTTRTLYAISDDRPRIVPLRLSDDFRLLTLGEPILVTVPHEWDGEGIALAPGAGESGFFIANEVGPHVYRLDRTGQSTAEIPLPAHFSRIRRNLSLEALTISPDGRYLFTANEQALDGELPSGGVGTLVRILRHDLSTGEQLEIAYRAEAPLITGRPAVADLAALSATELLVLERAFFPITGHSVHVYRANLANTPSVLQQAILTDDTPGIPKTLLLDLAALPDDDFPAPRQPQLNRVLDNFEGMALGPTLADGRRVLFLVSDDNKNDQQFARLLVLAVEGLP